MTQGALKSFTVGMSLFDESSRGIERELSKE